MPCVGGRTLIVRVAPRHCSRGLFPESLADRNHTQLPSVVNDVYPEPTALS